MYWLNSLVIVSFLQGPLPKLYNYTIKGSGHFSQHSTGPGHEEKKRPVEERKGAHRDEHELSPGHWSKKRAREESDRRDEKGAAGPAAPVRVKLEPKARERTPSVEDRDKKQSSDDSDDSTKGDSGKKKKKKKEKKKKKKKKEKKLKEKARGKSKVKSP